MSLRDLALGVPAHPRGPIAWWPLLLRGDEVAEVRNESGEVQVLPDLSEHGVAITVSKSPVADNLLDPLLIASGLRLHAFP